MERRQPILSLVIPVYRVEDCIARALDSVYSQKVDESLFEVIAVDDGSPDKSAEIIGNYRAGHSNLTLLRKPNGGVSSARNKGMEHAKGEWIIFLDADDAIAPGALKDLTGFLTEPDGEAGEAVRTPERMPDIIMMREVYAGSGTEKYSWKGMAEDMSPYTGMELFRNGYFRSTVTGLAIRRGFIKECGARFDERTAMGEDSTFIHSLLPYASCIIPWNRVLYLIHIRDGSASRTFTVDRLRACRYNLQAALELSRKVGRDAPESLPMIEFYRYSILLHYMKLAIEYRIPHAMRVFREIVPEGYIPLKRDGVVRERWKMWVMNGSLAAFYFLLEIQNLLTGKRIG